MKVNKVVEEWEIWNEKEETARLLWQPLDSQGLMISLMSKPQSRDTMWDIHKRTRQGASA